MPCLSSRRKKREQFLIRQDRSMISIMASFHLLLSESTPDMWMIFAANKEAGGLALISAKNIKKQKNTGKLEKGGGPWGKQGFLWQMNWTKRQAWGGACVCDKDQWPGSVGVPCAPAGEVPGST